MSFHTYEPDQSVDFYLQQNKIMEERYSALFRKNDLSWKKYMSNAHVRLGNNVYWMWIFLCGLDTFLKANSNLSFKNKGLIIKSLYKDAEDRIYRIIGDSKKNEEYIKSL